MRNPTSTLLLLTGLLLVGPVRAATVTNSADDGPGTLREAIANAAPGEAIDAAVNGPITLTSGELVIDKDRTSLGPGSGKLTIQRSLEPRTPEFRILRVLDASVTLSGLTIKNGRSDYGGGVLNEYSAVLLMQDVILSGNSAMAAGDSIMTACCRWRTALSPTIPSEPLTVLAATAAASPTGASLTGWTAASLKATPPQAPAVSGVWWCYQQ